MGLENDDRGRTGRANRRRFVKALGTLGMVGLAGCGGDGNETESPGRTETDDDGTATGVDPTGTDNTDTEDGTDTPTDTEGEETPTDTDTPDGTETETPNQNVPDDPPTVASLEGGGSVQPGGTVTLTVTVENPYLFPIQSIEVNLESPGDGWTVEAPGETNFDELETASSREVSWEVTAPEDASESVTITGSVSYATNTDSAETELSQSIAVFEPGEVPGGNIEAYYSLDGDTATNQITGTDATVVGEPTTGEPGVVGNAFGFTTDGSRNSTGDALTSGQDLPLNGEAATVGAWFRYTTKEDFARVYQIGGGGPDGLPDANGGWDLEFDSGSDDIQLITWQSGNANSTGTITLSSDTWYFVVSVVDGSDSTMYVFDQNGELDASPKSGSGRDQTGDDVLIMMGGDGSDAVGRMDEVRAYSRALSAAEVTALYEGSS
jgi:hypothetical protein